MEISQHFIDMLLNKEIILSYSSSTRKMRGSQKLIPVFEELNKSLLPQPTRIMWTNSKLEWEAANTYSYLDPLLLEKLDPKQRDNDVYDLWLDYNSESNVNLKVGMSFEDSLIIHLVNNIAALYNPIFYKNLFVSILNVLPNCEKGKCNVDMSRIYKEKFVNLPKPFLGWIQYFNNEIIMARGGFEEFEANHLLKTERIHDGLLIQVGQSPYDAFTPEGEELLVRATRSLPPVRK